MLQKLRKAILALLVACCPVAAVACIPGAIPAVVEAVSSVSKALSFLSKVDALVSEFFLRHPDIPASERETYLLLHSGAVTALTEYQRLVEAHNDLQNGEALAAFAKFEETYGKLSDWLTQHKLLTEGKLTLEGKALSELPPAASLRR